MMTLKEKHLSKVEQTSKMVDDLVGKANHALEEMKLLDQEKIDMIVQDMALAGLDQHMPLAKLASRKRSVVSMKIKLLRTFLPRNTFIIISNIDRKSTRL